MKFTFHPDIKTFAEFPRVKYNTEEISNEPMLFGYSLGKAMTDGGPITRRIIKRLCTDPQFTISKNKAQLAGLSTVIDTRVTMTMKGMYPSIPGWHCDDVPRGDKYEQPDLTKIDPLVQHYMVLFSDNETSVSSTEFVCEPFEAEIDEENVWGSLDREVTQKKPKTSKLDQNTLIRFSQTAIHRASLTETPGWRYFFRLSFTPRQICNTIRKQVQVYTTTNGW